jgi:type I restriction enzyme S subunit
MPPDGWTRMRLGDFVTLQRGHDLPDEQRRPGNIPILGSFGVTGAHDQARAPGPGVTVGRSGASFGVATYSQIDFWPLNTALYVIDFHGNHERFAYYFLKAFDFGGYNSGSAQPSLNRNFVHPVPVLIPPPEEQRAIASILGAIDDKIELNRRVNETLEAIARALFKSWFVDFDPVRAKAEGRDTGLPKQIADLFPARLIDSELGEIPEGWEVDSLESTAELIRARANPFETPDRVFSHYSIPAFDNGQLPLAEVGINIKSMKFCVAIGTVLFSKLNPTIERVWLVDPQPEESAICSTEFLVPCLSG